MYRYVIGRLAGGYEIYVNLISSPAGQYISRQPHVINLIQEALESIRLKKPKVSIEHDMGRIIGNTDIVETTEKDTVYYAQPTRKKVFSRFAKNRLPSPSRKLALILNKDEQGNYEVRDAWIGPQTPPFPGAEDETDESKQYWQTHALVQDAQTIQSKTITKKCPY